MSRDSLPTIATSSKRSVGIGARSSDASPRPRPAFSQYLFASQMWIGHFQPVQLTLIRQLFRSCLGDEPYSRGQWDTALRATPQSPNGDVSCGQCLRAPCTLKCPRLPVSPPSLIARAAQVLSD